MSKRFMWVGKGIFDNRAGVYGNNDLCSGLVDRFSQTL
jgi:hypothetical protein